MSGGAVFADQSTLMRSQSLLHIVYLLRQLCGTGHLHLPQGGYADCRRRHLRDRPGRLKVGVQSTLVVLTAHAGRGRRFDVLRVQNHKEAVEYHKSHKLYHAARRPVAKQQFRRHITAPGRLLLLIHQHRQLQQRSVLQQH
jgi:hypothetical protein